MEPKNIDLPNVGKVRLVPLCTRECSIKSGEHHECYKKLCELTITDRRFRYYCIVADEGIKVREQYFLTEQSEGRALVVLAYVNGELAARAELMLYGDEKGEIAFTTFEPFKGRGLAPLLAQTLREVAQNIALHELSVECHLENDAMAKVIEKAFQTHMRRDLEDQVLRAHIVL